jgi:hypothetical protein
MWWFWLEFQKLEPTCELGGIYAPKPGYHNYRDALPKTDYSVQLAADKLGPGNMAAGIDLTFPDAQAGRYATIVKYADRLLRSGLDPNDPRGNYLREFYGQADSDIQVEGWDFVYLRYVTSDSSHLWHLHLSFLRQFLNDLNAFKAVLSILRGETVAQWLQGGKEDVMYLVNIIEAGKVNLVYVVDGLDRAFYLNTYALGQYQKPGATVNLGDMSRGQFQQTFGRTVDEMAAAQTVPTAPAIDYDKLAAAILAQLLKPR